MRAIFDGWRKLGYLPPEIENHRAEKSFRLRLCKVKLITEAQLLAQASLGAHLTEHEAAVFAFLLRSGQVDIADIKALTGFTGSQALDLAQRLTVQVLTEPLGEAAHTWHLVPHLRTRFAAEAAENATEDQSSGTEAAVAGPTDQVTEQVAPEQAGLDRFLDRLTEVQWRIVSYADVPRSLAELMAHAGYRQRPHFVATHMEPLLAGGVLRPTIPDKPRSSRQT